MHAYPPEYDDPCVASIPAPELPEWLDPTIYWDEDGRVFVMRKDDGEQITVILEIEATGDDEADNAAIKARVMERFKVDREILANLSRELSEAYEAAQAATIAGMPTFDEFWEDIQDYVGIECDEAGDWTPHWCDSCDTWHSTANCVEYKVEDGVRYVVVRDVDQDGDWDSSYWNKDEWQMCYCHYISTDDHFKAWGEYHLWCAENGGIDPLDDFFHNAATIEKHLDAVRDSIKYLWMGVPHAVVEYADQEN